MLVGRASPPQPRSPTTPQPRTNGKQIKKQTTKTRQATNKQKATTRQEITNHQLTICIESEYSYLNHPIESIAARYEP